MLEVMDQSVMYEDHVDSLGMIGEILLQYAH